MNRSISQACRKHTFFITMHIYVNYPWASVEDICRNAFCYILYKEGLLRAFFLERSQLVECSSKLNTH